MDSARVSGWCWALAWLVACAASAGAQPVVSTTVTIRTLDERPLVYSVDRPDTTAAVPILVVVDGSGCVGRDRPGFDALYRPGPEAPAPYARVRVEKPGVEADAPHGTPCSDAFYQNYTMAGRVEDHLRVFQHLRATASWWDGRLLVWGWSDGGDIAARLLAYHPGVDRAVVGAAGGGLTMAELFEDVWVCPEATLGDDRPACLQDLRGQFDAMRDSLLWTRTWSGESNAWRSWPGRLDSRLSVLLRDATAPVLIVQGDADEATPVESARRLVADLAESGHGSHTYWEVPGMGHSWSRLGPEAAAALEDAMLGWLLGLPVEPPGGIRTRP